MSVIYAQPRDTVFGRAISSVRASLDVAPGTKPGQGSDMSQTKQQQQEAAAGSPRPREDWELFWRIIAGLMVLVIAWILWVLYQVTPRSVVTPLAYANRIRPIGRQQPASGAAAPALAPPTDVAPVSPSAAAATASPAVTSPALPPAATATEAPTDKAQAAVATGAHQPSADVRAPAAVRTEQQVQEVGLRLATEISTPATEKQGSVKVQEGASGSTPVAGAAGKQRP